MLLWNRLTVSTFEHYGYVLYLISYLEFITPPNLVEIVLLDYLSLHNRVDCHKLRKDR